MVLKRPCLLDWRAESGVDIVARVKEQWVQHFPALVTVAQRPRKRWTKEILDARALILSSAPAYELILWVDPKLDLAIPSREAQALDGLLGGYRTMFSVPTLDTVQAYVQALHDHVLSQEAHLYKGFAALMPGFERVIRELTYEHRGLEKTSVGLATKILAYARGELSKREREHMDLEHFHLLEHHIEREKEALWPALRFFEAIG